MFPFFSTRVSEMQNFFFTLGQQNGHHHVNEDAEDGEDGGKLDDDVILEEDEGDGDESGNESGSEGSEGDVHIHHHQHKQGGSGPVPPHTFICQGCQHNAAQNLQKDNLMTKWLKNNFDPRYVFSLLINKVFYS